MGVGRKIVKEKRESLFARLYFCETYSSPRYKGCTSPSSCSRCRGRGWERKAEKARWILDAINLASAFVRIACVPGCLCAPVQVCVGVRKAHPRTLRSRVFNAFVAL